MRKYSRHEIVMRDLLDESGLASGRKQEYQFHPTRRWRLDFAYPRRKIGIEVEGVVWRGKGRHQTGKGMQGDCEKYNTALLMGWKILRVVPKQMKSGEAMSWIREIMGRTN